MRIRSELFDLLLRIAEEDQLADFQLAHMFGVSRPRANNLLHRHIEKFNSETLIDMLARLGVRLRLTPISRDQYRRWNFPKRA